jgi:uncharacterized protein
MPKSKGIVNALKQLGTFEVERDAKREWRWRLKTVNGELVAESGEGYKNRQHCIGIINHLWVIAMQSTVVVKPAKRKAKS